jgi:CHAT domain-containing protein/tetratricopeptide (TPR) repeat protein
MKRLMLCVLAVVACAAAPPARLTPEQEKLLQERLAFRQRAGAEWKAGKRAEAVTSMGKARALAVRVYGASSFLAYSDTTWLAAWEQVRRNWKKAATHHERMWRVMATLRGKEDWRTVDADWGARTARLRAGWTEARNRQWDEAGRLNDQVFRLWQQGRFAEALPLAKRGFGLRRTLVGEKHPYVATSLFNVAAQYRGLGDNKAAVPFLRRALTIQQETLGESHPKHVNALRDLANLYSGLGEHRLALPLCQKYSDLIREQWGEGHHLYADSLNTLAFQYDHLGDNKAAARHYRRSLAIIREVRGVKSSSYAMGLLNLASVYSDVGEDALALPLLQQAVEIMKELKGLGGLHAACLNKLAQVRQARKEYKEALSLFKQSLDMAKDGGGEKHAHHGVALNNLATLHLAMGDHKAALPLFLKSTAIYKEAFGERHPEYAIALNNLAGLYQHMGEHKKALPLIEEALAIAAAQLRDDAAVQSDRVQFAAAAEFRFFLDRRLSCPDGEKHPPAATHVLTWKGSLLLRHRWRHLFLRLAADSATRAAAERLRVATIKLAALRQSPAATRARMEALEAEQEAAQAELSKLSAAFHDQREKERPTPEAVAKALPEGVVLVDYLFYKHNGLKDKDGKPRIERRLVAFIHRKGKAAARADLGAGRPVEEAVGLWRAELLRGGNGLKKGAEVKRLVWAPLEKHLAGAKTILVSPDRELNTVPLAALPGKKPGTYLVEDVALALVPVPSAIPELVGPKKDRLLPSLLVASDLRYDPEDRASVPVAGADDRSPPRTGRERFSRLPATGAEALAVRAAFEKLFKGGKATALSEGEATKPTLRKALAEVRYAHLATHGYFAPETVKSLADSLGGDPLTASRPTGWHPLLLSGLALSDANRVPKAGEEDGILTALEVSEMQLPQLELVVLSACETGLGKSAGGEGLHSLQRAFHMAGARSVVASLWKVDDRATQALMAEFYALAWDTKKIISRAEALRQAQLMLIKEGKRRGLGKKGEKLPKEETRLPPLYWAAFVLSGDWR